MEQRQQAEIEPLQVHAKCYCKIFKIAPIWFVSIGQFNINKEIFCRFIFLKFAAESLYW